MTLTKIFLYVAIGCALVASGAAAESEMKLHFGGAAGLNLANESVGDLPEGESKSMRPGLRIGGSVDYQVTPMVSVGTGLVYQMKGANYDWKDGNDTGEGASKLTFLTIPMTARAVFPGTAFRPYVKAGPQVGLLLSAKHSAKGTYDGFDYDEETDVKDNLKSMEIGFEVGGGVMIPFGDLMASAEVAYDLGLTDLVDVGDADSELKTRTIYLTFGVGK